MANGAFRQGVATVFGDKDQMSVEGINAVPTLTNIYSFGHIAPDQTTGQTRSMILRGFRYKLAPSAEPEALFRQFAGVCHLIYNLVFEQRRAFWRHDQRQTGRQLNCLTQTRKLTALRAQYDWIGATSQTCQQQALRGLDQAFDWHVSFARGIAHIVTASICSAIGIDRSVANKLTLSNGQHLSVLCAHAGHNAAINILRRSTGSMRLEKRHQLCGDVQSGWVFPLPENPQASAGGRC